MSHHDDESKAQDSKEELRLANERRIEELLDINNRYVRTQRHLEQNTDIMPLDRLQHVFKIQEEREDRMENLKNIIAYDRHEGNGQAEILKKRLEYTDHYLQHHADHMDEFTLQKTNEKQEHRKEQLDFFD
jgi:hypothetical protein